MTYHKSVLVQEVIEYLDIKPDGVYVDATFGGGGHTRAILEHEPTCQVIAFDWDTVALEHNAQPLHTEFGDRFSFVWANFSQIDRHLKKEGYDKVDGILADFGTSQHQLTQRAGFSFSSDTPLDMRMAPGHQKVTAMELLNKATEEKLCSLFFELGEEPKARAIARLIVKERAQNPIRTTKQLVALIEKVVPRSAKKLHPATQVFQALRLYVNKELENIQSFLPAALRALHPSGRLVCISFHSLEDRIVKQFFKEQESLGCASVVTPHAVIGSAEEITINPSARSAKLRALEKKI